MGIKNDVGEKNVIYNVILILIEIVLFIFVYISGGWAYSEWQNIEDMYTPNDLTLSYTLKDDSNIIPPEILVTMPDKWKAEEKISVRYTVVSFGQPPQDIELTIHGGDNLIGLDVPVIFKVGGNTPIDRDVTVSEEAQYLTSVKSIGIIKSDTAYTVSEPTTIKIIGLSYWWIRGFILAIFFTMFLIALFCASFSIYIFWIDPRIM